jgi:lipopolysaccharide/colanic/teichoic acid biosynthesis glycosyltransferase
MIITYLLLIILEKENPFFLQERPGLNEKIFKIIKFRSMSSEKDENGKLLKDDLRLTKLGKFLRITSIDELPQLINILKGEMSFVGPRPLRVRYLPFYTNEERVRHTVKPGITGLSQISGRNSISWDNRFRKDIEYVKGISFLSDFKILVMTFFKLFRTTETYISSESDNLDEHRAFTIQDSV